MTARPGLAIGLLLIAMVCISINDMLIKEMSGDYPLHQIVFIRSAIGICFTMVFLQFEGGFRALKTRRPWLHALRAGLLVGANVFFFAGLAAMPLAETSALFFVAPLMITLLSVPVLGQRIGPRRLVACGFGFLGVLVMLAPGQGGLKDTPHLTLLLPVLAASCYAGMQVMTRLLGSESPASALSFYIQAGFILLGAVFWFVAGDGRFAESVNDPSLEFLLRAWRWPTPGDAWLLVLIGSMVGVLGYTIAQAYRLGDPATLAPFEYVALPLAVLWGFLIFGEVPGLRSWIGIALIVGSGLFVFLRERSRGLPPARAGRRP
ncbi:MAG: DMT family transporter [Pseudomonadota bacterium]